VAVSRKRNVEIQVLVDDRQAKQNLKNIDGAARQSETGWGKYAAAAKIAAGSFVATQAVQAIGEVVGAATDLNESINAVEKTFGPAAAGILKLGETAAESFGMSNSEFNAFAVGFAAFAENIAGASGQSVITVIEQMSTRIADFASVMNIDLAEASDKFRSGLAGETEPLRKFGIDVSAAAVEAKGLEMGLGATSAELTEQEKILIRYQLIMDQTEKTAGDFADTSDELANQQRILKANIEDTKATIGGLLTPAVSEMTGAFADSVNILDVFVKKLNDLGGEGDGALGEDRGSCCRQTDRNGSGRGGRYFPNGPAIPTNGRCPPFDGPPQGSPRGVDGNRRECGEPAIEARSVQPTVR
jgi:hypothetical protein